MCELRSFVFMACCSLCVRLCITLYYCMHLCLCSHKSSSFTQLPPSVSTSASPPFISSPLHLYPSSISLSPSLIHSLLYLFLLPPFSLFTLLLPLHVSVSLFHSFSPPLTHFLPSSYCLPLHLPFSLSPSTPPSLSVICLLACLSLSHPFIDTGHYVTSMPSGCSLFWWRAAGVRVECQA